MQDKLIPNIPTTVVMWFIFMAAFLVVRHFILLPTIALIKERRSRSAGLDQKAREMEAQIQGKFEDYQGQMAVYRKQAKVIREEILRSAAEDRARIVDAARVNAESYLEKGRKEIASLQQTAATQLAEESQKIAQEILNKLTGRQAA